MKGNVDLAARFVLRAERLLSARGQLGYVTTNTLVEGDTLEVGMEQASALGLTVRGGRPPHPWPTTSANLQIVEVWASRAPLSAEAACWLDGEAVPAIGPDLEPYRRIRGHPEQLRENDGIAFIGSYVLGLGFTLTFEQKDELIERNPRNADVLQPYVIGKDLNQSPDCSASRWIINFRAGLWRDAQEYPDCLDIVRRLSSLIGIATRKANYRKHWWRFGGPASALYEAIGGLDRALAICLHGSVVMPVQVQTDQVFSHGSAVFALDDFANLALLSSSIHSTWVIRYT